MQCQGRGGIGEGRVSERGRGGTQICMVRGERETEALTPEAHTGDNGGRGGNHEWGHGSAAHHCRWGHAGAQRRGR